MEMTGLKKNILPRFLQKMMILEKLQKKTKKKK